MSKLNKKYKEMQQAFKIYLEQKGESSISTTKCDAFYLCRNYTDIDFMELLNSDSFEQLAREYLKNTNAPKSSINSYMSSMRKLKKFLQEKSYDFKINTPSVYAEKTDDIPYPSCDNVEIYLHKWNTSASLYEPETALNKLFNQICPYNTSLNDIMLKVAALNTVYNTHITDVYTISQHILSLDIDSRLKDGNENLVNELMHVKYINDQKTVYKNHYSFSSKYCSFHNPDAFPIYDSYVDSILWHYQKTTQFYAFDRKDLKNYPKFKSAIKAFQLYFGLEQYTVKQLDQYLWQFGKEYF